MNKEEVLQKVNDYCNEKSYTTSTLTNGFKEKFAEHFAKLYENVEADDENALANMKFAINSAFSGASQIITEKSNSFSERETEYKKTIAELENKLKDPKQQQQFELPKEVQDELNELKKFRNEEMLKSKFDNIVSLAKKNIREDLHKSFDKFVKTYNVSLDKDEQEQADGMAKTFQEIFKDSIGDIRPFTPKQIQQREDDWIEGVKKYEV